ncbi:MAG: Smr/MutS family protein [Bacteroidetes bacterium]|nr:Smr/MutS family protein [Bacteroidota bacterium]
MKFSIGDRIILKRTGEEGSVTAFINEQMLEVEVNGTHFPVYADEIDHPYLDWFTNKKKEKKKIVPEQLPVEKEKLRPPRLAKGIYLSFLPVFKMDEFEDVVDYVKVHLLNELPVPIRFDYDVKLNEQTLFKHDGTLHAFGHLYLHNIAFADMSAQPRFNWRLIDAVNKEMKTEDGVLRIRPQKLFAHITELLRKNEASFSYLLIEDFEERKQEPQPEKYIPSPPKPKTISLQSLSGHLEGPRYEIDLHIEKLVPSRRGMSNAEILQLQLDTLQKYLQLALVHRQNKMVVVHGKGDGVLRNAVHNLLRRNKEIEYYELVHHGGATEVFFKR